MITGPREEATLILAPGDVIRVKGGINNPIEGFPSRIIVIDNLVTSQPGTSASGTCLLAEVIYKERRVLANRVTPTRQGHAVHVNDAVDFEGDMCNVLDVQQTTVLIRPYPRRVEIRLSDVDPRSRDMAVCPAAYIVCVVS